MTTNEDKTLANPNNIESEKEKVPFAFSSDSLKMRKLQREDPKEEQILALYNASFPDCERKPFEMILSGQDEGKMEAWILQDQDTVAGLAFMILGKTINVLDYLAVSPLMRNHHLGSQILNWIEDHYSDKPYVVEIESTKTSEDEMVHRRKGFYLRNRFVDAHADFYLFGVQMELLSRPGLVNYETYYLTMKDYFGDELVKHLKTV